MRHIPPQLQTIPDEGAPQTAGQEQCVQGA